MTETPEALLCAIRRLYRQLQAMPHAVPKSSVNRHAASPQYLAIEGQIRAYADRYMALVEQEVKDEEDRQARMANSRRLTMVTPRRPVSSIAASCDPTTTYEPKPLTWGTDADRRARRVKAALSSFVDGRAE